MPKKICLLLVEDEEEFASMVKARLEGNGYEVLTAGDGARGLELAKQKKPDLILLDQLMPVMDGYTTLSKLKEFPGTRAIPVIIFSAKAQPEDLRRARELGACDYIVKPFEPNALFERIGKALALPI